MRLPVRVRLTAWYATLLALILAALGSFVVLRLEADLQERVDRDLWIAAGKIGGAYSAEGRDGFLEVARAALARRQAAAQVVDRGGRVLESFGTEGAARGMLPAATRERVLLGARPVTTVRLDGGRRFRAAAMAVRRLRHRHVLVVAGSLGDVEALVHRLVVLFAIAAPAALLGTAVVGWVVARKALLPVDRMASAADAVEIDRLDERIAVPRARDELAHLAETFNAMLARLESGVSMNRRLVADASHELRTPLAVMRTELDVSLGDEGLPEEARPVLESAREEVDRMTRTVENLLTLAQADEGRLAVLRTPVDLLEAVEGTVRPLRPLAEHKAIRLCVDGESCTVHADPQRLQQALTNLIENAVKFTASGGEVRVTVWREGGEAGVTVADDGPGIPAEARAHIFDRFYRVDQARARAAGGSGLGLAICHEIARAHGGRVALESEEGRGSAFSLVLPADGRARSAGSPVTARA